MNVHGHLEVAARCGADPATQVGAALPDLAAMLRVRLDHAVMPSALRAGVALHHRTDGVFHDHPVVRAEMARLSEAVRACGIGRGPARAIGHVGYELLLDATVRRDRLAAALDVVDEDLVHRVLGEPPQWHTLRGHLTGGASRHDAPAWVAERLFHILDRRPRLRFPAEHVPAVAAALAERAPSIHAHAPQVVADVSAAVLPIRSAGA